MRYQNPVIPGLNSDPSACRVGEDYYLVTSSFPYYPALPIYHSRDLVHFEQIGNAIDRPDMLSFKGTYYDGGTWAPTIRYHDGTFYIVNGVFGNAETFYYMITASRPEGPWSDPIQLPPCFDPDLFFDDDGKCYLSYSDGGVWIVEYSLEEHKTVGEPKKIFHGPLYESYCVEGSHIYKINGWYYLLLAEGGTGFHHSVNVARSDALFGRYVPDPVTPILTHRHLGQQYPITCVGHADIVDTPDGKYYMYMLAKRPIGGFSHLGRETFLAEVTFEDGWPVVNPGHGIVLSEGEIDIEEHPMPVELASIPFDKPLPPYIVTPFGPPPKGYSVTDRGWLRLPLSETGIQSEQPASMLCRRNTSRDYRLTAQLEFSPEEGDRAGIAVIENLWFYLTVCVTKKDGQRMIRVDNDTYEVKTCVYEGEVPACVTELEIEVHFPSAKCYATYQGERHFLGEADIHEISSEGTCSYNGTVSSIFATGNSEGYADFGTFKLESL